MEKVKVKDVVRVVDGVFTVQAQHPEFGWIPFTWSEEDKTDFAVAVGNGITKAAKAKAKQCPSVAVVEGLIAREWRDAELKNADALIEIALDDDDMEAVKAVRKYRKELRDWPSKDGFPSVESRPTLGE